MKSVFYTLGPSRERSPPIKSRTSVKCIDSVPIGRFHRNHWVLNKSHRRPSGTSKNLLRAGFSPSLMEASAAPGPLLLASVSVSSRQTENISESSACGES